MISVMASSETVSMVKLTSFITNSVTKSEVGIAIITTIALRQERRKNSIAMPVKQIPSSSVCMTLHSCCSVNVAALLRTLSWMSGYCAASPGSASMTACAACTSLAPVAFCACNVTADLASTYEATRLGSKLSSTVATSPIRGRSCAVENGLVTLAPAPEDAPPPPLGSAVIGAGTTRAIAGGATLVAVVVEIKAGALVGGAVTLASGTACAAGGSVAVASVVAPVVVLLVVGVVADVVDVVAPAATGAALAAPAAALVVVKVLVVAVDVVLAPLDDEFAAATAALVPPPAPPPTTGAVVVVVALAAAAFESESAWFVLPLRFEYFWFTEPEGEVAPSSTAVEPVNSRLATEAGVCTSPRTSMVVSRLPR